VVTDGWRSYTGLPAKGYGHEPVNLSAFRGDAAAHLPAIHLVFSLVKRWLLGTLTTPHFLCGPGNVGDSGSGLLLQQGGSAW
jgi:hypothetical protein